MSDFVKHDAEKNRLELLPFAALESVSKVLTLGAKKYDDHNWAKVPVWSRYLGAATRHLFAWARGEDKDPETGESHLAHAVCCLLFLMELQRMGTSTDDRRKS